MHLVVAHHAGTVSHRSGARHNRGSERIRGQTRSGKGGDTHSFMMSMSRRLLGDAAAILCAGKRPKNAREKRKSSGFCLFER